MEKTKRVKVLLFRVCTPYKGSKIIPSLTLLCLEVILPKAGVTSTLSEAGIPRDDENKSNRPPMYEYKSAGNTDL